MSGPERASWSELVAAANEARAWRERRSERVYARTPREVVRLQARGGVEDGGEELALVSLACEMASRLDELERRVARLEEAHGCLGS